MIRRLLRNAIYWTYERGSWQWDLSCIVFLVVIFVTPGDFLESYTLHPLEPEEIRSILRGIFASFLG